MLSEAEIMRKFVLKGDHSNDRNRTSRHNKWNQNLSTQMIKSEITDTNFLSEHTDTNDRNTTYQHE